MCSSKPRGLSILTFSAHFHSCPFKRVHVFEKYSISCKHRHIIEYFMVLSASKLVFCYTFSYFLLQREIYACRTGLNVYTFAGNGKAGTYGDSGLATVAGIQSPFGIVGDKNNVYVSDKSGAVVRSVNKVTNIINTIAGTINVYGSTGDYGPATSSTMLNPAGLCIDNSGNVLVADSGNNWIRQINITTGIIFTVAGGGSSFGEGVNPILAKLYFPQGCVYDSFRNLYIADTLNNVIRKIDASTGLISTYAGDKNSQLSGASGNGGPATNALLNSPYGVTVDASNNLYIADTMNHVIRVVNSVTKKISVYTGNSG